MNKDNLNWNDLKFFLQIARKGRLLTAGKALGVEHTTVSRRIKALETALKSKLFEQDDTGFSLTPVGESLLPIAQEVEDAIELAKEKTFNNSDLSGVFRVGAPDGFGNTFLTEEIIDFTKLYPEIKIELVAVPLTHNLFKREVDMAISLEPSERKGIISKKITDYHLYLYTSKKYLEENDVDLTSISSIRKQAFAGYIPDILYTNELDFNTHISKDIAPSFESSTVISQHQFIKSGGGFAVLPYFMVKDESDFVRVDPELLTFKRTYWLLIPSHLSRLASVRAMENFILSRAREKQHVFFG